VTLQNTQIIQHIYKKYLYIPFLLTMKVYFNENFVNFFVSYFLRFISILIHCGSFIVDPEQVINNKSFSSWLRNINVYKLVSIFGINNLYNFCFILYKTTFIWNNCI